MHQKIHNKYSSGKQRDGFPGTFGTRAKDKDKAAVFHVIQECGPISQKEILHSYSIRPADLSAAVKELQEDELITKVANRTNTGPGRPEVLFEACNDRFTVLAIYTDSWIFRGAAIDLKGDPIEQVNFPMSPNASAEAIHKAQYELLTDLKHKLPEYTDVLGIGVSLPGNVDRNQLAWRESRRWPNVRNLRYSSWQEDFGCAVTVMRDLDAAMTNELIHRPGVNGELAVLVHWGIGVGVSVSAHGSIIESNHGRFGTVSDMQLNPEHRDHRFGADIEKVTSLTALINDLRKKYDDLPLDERAVERITDFDDLSDFPSFARATDYIGMILRNLVLMFYPDRLLLLSPFIGNQAILSQVEKSFRNGQLIEDLQQSVALSTIPDGYRGCMFGVTHQLREQELGKHLKARY